MSPLQKDKRGRSSLHYAAANGKLDVLKYFTKARGCNAACSDKEGWTPLHYAARFNHLLLVQYLMEKQQVNRSIEISTAIPHFIKLVLVVALMSSTTWLRK